MSQNIPDMIENTLSKIRDMVNVNTVVGEPITVPGDVTIIPVSKVSVGLGGGGLGNDSGEKAPGEKKHVPNGGAGGAVKITPIAFLIVKDGNVRMLPVATPANTTTDRLVEMVPDVLDRITTFVDNHSKKTEE